MKFSQFNPGRLVRGFFTSVFMAALSAGAMAQSSGIITEARVVDSQPVYQTVQVNTPSQECWQEPVQVESKNYSSTPAILGAIIGGSIGNEFGSGDSGRDVATVAGAVLGGSIGHDIEKGNQRSNSRTVYEQRCRTVSNVSTEQRFQGYDVTYEYNDQLFTARTSNHPGQTIRVSVSVIPVE